MLAAKSDAHSFSAVYYSARRVLGVTDEERTSGLLDVLNYWENADLIDSILAQNTERSYLSLDRHLGATCRTAGSDLLWRIEKVSDKPHAHQFRSAVPASFTNGERLALGRR